MRLIDIGPCETHGHACLMYVTEDGGLVQAFTSELPTIDAVPIVRCRESKHFQADEIAVQSTGTCWHCEMVRKFDDFCSYGERKDGEG